MTCDRLVCANCAGPVSEGRCATCRASRQRLRQESPWAALTPTTLIALIITLCTIAAVVNRTA